jgi:hypothetical protein
MQLLWVGRALKQETGASADAVEAALESVQVEDGAEPDRELEELLAQDSILEEAIQEAQDAEGPPAPL